MTTKTLEDRLTTVEDELMHIKRQLAVSGSQPGSASWEKIFGSFAESDGFEEAIRLGREYRETQGAKENTPS